VESSEDGLGALGVEGSDGKGVDDLGEGRLDGVGVLYEVELDVEGLDGVALGAGGKAVRAVALEAAEVEVAVGKLADCR
jgi:hypothetical protein